MCTVAYPLIGYFTSKNGIRDVEPAKLDTIKDAAKYIHDRINAGNCRITDILDRPVVSISDSYIANVYVEGFAESLIAEITEIVKNDTKKGEKENVF